MKSLVPLFCSLSTELGQEAVKICSKLFVGNMGLNHEKTLLLFYSSTSLTLITVIEPIRCLV